MYQLTLLLQPCAMKISHLGNSVDSSNRHHCLQRAVVDKAGWITLYPSGGGSLKHHHIQVACVRSTGFSSLLAVEVREKCIK